MIHPSNLSRRAMLSTPLAGIAIAAFAAAPTSAAIAPDSEEAGNIRLVDAFCAAWTETHVDAGQLVDRYFADDCIVRVMDSTMIARGKTAVTGMFASWLEGDRRFELKILKSAALGPIVVNIRTDIAYSPGNQPHLDKIASVFILSRGKIAEWSDYVM